MGADQSDGNGMVATQGQESAALAENSVGRLFEGSRALHLIRQCEIAQNLEAVILAEVVTRLGDQATSRRVQGLANPGGTLGSSSKIGGSILPRGTQDDEVVGSNLRQLGSDSVGVPHVISSLLARCYQSSSLERFAKV
jgi:hypothetical protein